MTQAAFPDPRLKDPAEVKKEEATTLAAEVGQWTVRNLTVERSTGDTAEVVQIQNLMNLVGDVKGDEVWNVVDGDQVEKLFGVPNLEGHRFIVHFQKGDRKYAYDDIKRYHLVELWREVNGVLEDSPMEAELIEGNGPHVSRVPRRNMGVDGRFPPTWPDRIAPNPTTRWLLDPDYDADTASPGRGLNPTLAEQTREFRMAGKMAQLLLASNDVYTPVSKEAREVVSMTADTGDELESASAV